SGSPRSRMPRSGFSAVIAASAPAASSAVTTRCPAATRLARRKRRIGGSSSTTSIVKALAMRRGRRAHFGSRSYGDEDREHRAGAIAAITRLDPAALRFDKATADRQTKPSAGALPILGADAIEFIEDAFEIAS